jgi:hypothetical protein
VPDERPRAPTFASPALAALLATVLALGMTWPLVLHLGSNITQDLGDPLFESWQVAWMGHALLHHPLNLFQANRFWPQHDSLAFTDVMLGYAPAGVVAEQGPHAALVVHNLLFIFAYALAFLGAHLLAVELGAGRFGGIVAGAAFAYAPWRLSQNGHLQVISSGAIPLSLFLLLRGYRRGSGRTVLAGWLVATWQITLGFTLGVQFTYLLFVLALAVAALWLRRARPPVTRPVLGASVAGVCLFALVLALQARPFLRVIHDHPEAKRKTVGVAFYSPPPRGFLAAPPESFLWSGPTAHERNSLRSDVEQTMFPGVAVLVLAVLGLASSCYRPGIRVWLAIGTVLCGVLSVGLYSSYPNVSKGGFTLYRLFYDLAPGWNAIRTPGRLNTLTSLGLALLAGAGLGLIVRYLRSLSIVRQEVAAGAAFATTAALTGVVLLEGFGPIPHPRVPPVPRGQLGAPAPQLHLPSDDSHDDGYYSYWSIAGFPKLVNGAASFNPTALAQLRQAVTGFPDPSSVGYLRRLGVRTVVLHPDFAVGTPWQGAAKRPTAGLPLRREDKDGVILYHLG